MTETFLATLWPSSIGLSQEIEKEISKHYNIVSSQEYTMSKEEFKKFMYKIYKPDKTPESRIKKKYKAMSKYGTSVKIVEIEIQNPTMAPHKKTRLKGTFYCKEMKKLKREIRGMFSSQVKGYVYDIIMHVSDNQGHNKRARKLLKKYANRKS